MHDICVKMFKAHLMHILVLNFKILRNMFVFIFLSKPKSDLINRLLKFIFISEWTLVSIKISEKKRRKIILKILFLKKCSGPGSGSIFSESGSGWKLNGSLALFKCIKQWF